MKDNKKLIIIGSVILAIFLIGFFIFKILAKPAADTEQIGNVLPKTSDLKKVESSVKVNVDLQPDGHYVLFKVSGIPDKYASIEYEFMYETGSGGLQGGVSSPAKIKNNQYSKEILLGTCSAGGACSYDKGVKSIKFTVLFSSSKEKRFFEKEFTL